MNALIPRVPRSGSVFAKTMYTSACGALLMNIFDPLMAYPSACNVAVVVCAAASVPAAGSVRANAPSRRPDAMSCRYRSFWASVPYL
jgi:hypothetical protein